VLQRKRAARPVGDFSLYRAILRLPRQTKRLVAVTADLIMIPLALLCAFAVDRHDVVPASLSHLALFPTAVMFSVPIFARLGLYRAVVRFMGSRATFAVVKGVTFSLLPMLAVAGLLMSEMPWSVFVIYWAFALIYVGGSRFIVRSYLQRQRGTGEQVIIYGAGEAGARLAFALSGGQGFVPVAFVDDNPSTHDTVIHGLEVYSPQRLPQLVDYLEVPRVLLALPSVSRHRRQEILNSLEPLGVHVQTMPDLPDIVSGNARVDDLRDVDTADLLGRDPVPPVLELLSHCISGKVVLVTGAGGSIGSELCRQIVKQKPRRLVLLELSELALYTIERELRQVIAAHSFDLELIALLGSVQQRLRMRELMQIYEIDTVYHAAAYKHVPLVEQNMIDGLQNNVFGTWHTAEAAIEAKVETFVLVSTDKAVLPTNVMGASKRFAELVLQALHQRNSPTRFCMVRFGNVLESSGSVVPLFRDQIRQGGPITVTHPEIIRYFMTIPEAAQLVIQAGAMGEGGDVFVLDMGKPVKIDDLARRLVKLVGLTVKDEENPDGDIEICYTGLRPAEKLYEELLIGNNVAGTQHPRIMRAIEESLGWRKIHEFLEQLQLATQTFNCARAREVLCQAVAGYTPACRVEDLVWQQRERLVRPAVEAGKVADLGRFVSEKLS
jgi:FlaA1/EpsC-like NDP-sugar epimerase